MRLRIFVPGKARRRVIAALWRGGATPPGAKRRRAASELLVGQDTGLLYTNEIGVRQHQPLRALPLEIDLDSGMRSITLEIEHHSVAELRMPDPAAHAHACARRLLEAAAAFHEYRARHLQARPNFLDQVGRQLVD